MKELHEIQVELKNENDLKDFNNFTLKYNKRRWKIPFHKEGRKVYFKNGTIDGFDRGGYNSPERSKYKTYSFQEFKNEFFNDKLTREKLVDGEYYTCYYSNNNISALTKWGNCIVDIEFKDFKKYNSNTLSNKYYTYKILPSTKEEVQWLEACIKANKFIPKEEALKKFEGKAVHCTTQDEWDFVTLKTKKISWLHYSYNYEDKNCINLGSLKRYNLEYYKNLNYQILSFQEWLDENGYTFPENKIDFEQVQELISPKFSELISFDDDTLLFDMPKKVKSVDTEFLTIEK